MRFWEFVNLPENQFSNEGKKIYREIKEKFFQRFPTIGKYNLEKKYGDKYAENKHYLREKNKFCLKKLWQFLVRNYIMPKKSEKSMKGVSSLTPMASHYDLKGNPRNYILLKDE